MLNDRRLRSGTPFWRDFWFWVKLLIFVIFLPDLMLEDTSNT